MVFPVHYYQGDTVSTAARKSGSIRGCGALVDEYIDLMGNLKLAQSDDDGVVLPANMHVGRIRTDLAKQGWRVSRARESRAWPA